MGKEKKVKIRVLPLRGIGGVGKAGDEALVTKAEADQWVADGYAEIISDEEAEVVPSTAAGAGEEPQEAEEDADAGDHKIMKPGTRR